MQNIYSFLRHLCYIICSVRLVKIKLFSSYMIFVVHICTHGKKPTIQPLSWYASSTTLVGSSIVQSGLAWSFDLDTKGNMNIADYFWVAFIAKTCFELLKYRLQYLINNGSICFFQKMLSHLFVPISNGLVECRQAILVFRKIHLLS